MEEYIKNQDQYRQVVSNNHNEKIKEAVKYL